MTNDYYITIIRFLGEINTEFFKSLTRFVDIRNSNTNMACNTMHCIQWLVLKHHKKQWGGREQYMIAIVV